MGKVLVFGGGGQLGQSLRHVSEKIGFKDMFFPAEEDADILNIESLIRLFEKHKPTYAINCAAYTAVDKAEDEVDLARKINRDGAENLAKLCRENDCCLIHISTDFVFEGDAPKLLTEEDSTNPISVYGLTKLEGEQVIISNTDKYYIFRTSWLYSQYGNNFVKTMLKLAETRNELSVIADQAGTPTYALDLADAILKVIQLNSAQYGVYHYSNEGLISWYDFAVNIFDIATINIKVKPIKTSEYPTKAQRPKFSAMDKSKIKAKLGITIPYWRDSLITCIKALK